MDEENRTGAKQPEKEGRGSKESFFYRSGSFGILHDHYRRHIVLMALLLILFLAFIALVVLAPPELMQVVLALTWFGMGLSVLYSLLEITL